MVLSSERQKGLDGLLRVGLSNICVFVTGVWGDNVIKKCSGHQKFLFLGIGSECKQVAVLHHQLKRSEVGPGRVQRRAGFVQQPWL